MVVTVSNINIINQLLGDVDGDGEIGIKDIMAINAHRLGKTELIGKSLEVADVTGDGLVDIKDIMKINAYRLGKLTSL